MPSKFAGPLEDTRADDLFDDDEALPRTESFADLGLEAAASWPPLGFADEFLSKASAEPPSDTEQHGVWSSDYHYDHFTSIHPSQLPATPITPPQLVAGSGSGDDCSETLLSGAAPIPMSSEEANSTSGSIPVCDGNRQYMQRLCEFNACLARPMNLVSDASPTHIEQAAAHVLESSAIFLELVKFPQRNTSRGCEPQDESQQRHRQTSVSADPRGNSQRNTPVAASMQEEGDFIPDTATILQLLVFSMRLTELHYGLYTAVYRYMQQQDHLQQPRPSSASSSAVSTGAGESAPPLPFSLSIAGVALTPHPKFQLQLLLQTGAHYLGNIHEALAGLEALQGDGSGSRQPLLQDSTDATMLMRMLMIQDQQRRMEGIREVLAKLREDFGMIVHV